MKRMGTTQTSICDIGGEDGHVVLEMSVGWWRPWDGDGVGVGIGDVGGRGTDGSDGDGDGGGGEVMVQVGRGLR